MNPFRKKHDPNFRDGTAPAEGPGSATLPAASGKAPRPGTARLTLSLAVLLTAFPAALAANPVPQEREARSAGPASQERQVITARPVIVGSRIGDVGLVLPTRRSETRSTPVEVGTLVEEALANNPGLESIRQRWHAAQAVPAGVHDLPDPSIRFGVYNLPLDTLNFSRGEFRIQYRQEFPARGTRDRRSAVAELEAGRQGFGFEATRVELAAAVRRGYYELYFAERAREIHHEHLALVRELSTAAEELYATGQVPQENVLRSLVELSELFAQLADVESRIGIATAGLNRLLHRPAGAPMGAPRPPRIIREQPAVQSLIKRALNRHPGVAEATAAVDRDQAAVELEQHESKPDFGITAEWWTGSTPVGRTYRYAFLVTTTLPFVHDAKYSAAVDRTLASKRSAEAARLDVMNRVAEGVSTAWIRLQAQARIVELYQTSVIPQSQQSLEAARSSYRTGSSGFVSVVDNERTLLLSRLALARAEADYGIALADLGAALGVIDPEEVSGGSLTASELVPEGGRQ